jgi:hypothetical protein
MARNLVDAALAQNAQLPESDLGSVFPPFFVPRLPSCMHSLDAMKRRAELQLTNGLEWLRRYSFKITVVSPIGIPTFLAWYTRYAWGLYSSMTGCRPRSFTPPSTSYFSFAKRAILQSVSTFRTAAADPLGMKSSALIIDTVPPLPSQPDSSGRPSGPSYR